jgi:hypothetical protein
MTAAGASVDNRPTGLALAIAAGFILLIWLLSLGGIEPFEVAKGAPSSGVAEGTWISAIVVWFFTALSLPWPLATVLEFFWAGAVGVLLAWLYRRLVYNDWPAFEALVFVGSLGLNAVVVSAVATDHSAIPVMLACAAVIPGIRRLESVGDVQAEMSFGLVLPLLFLAGPTTALLVPVLAAFGALSDRVARQDGKAFIAMFLVAIMPTVLVLTGMLGVFGATVATSTLATIQAVIQPRLLDAVTGRALLSVAAYTVLPFAPVIVAYWFNWDRRRQPWSAVAVIALPIYLIAGALVFSWPVPPTLPTAAVLAGFASWLSVARLRPAFRRACIGLILLAVGLSWSPPVLSNIPFSAARILDLTSYLTDLPSG